MAIRITETTERWCCAFVDLKDYKGVPVPFAKPKFCIHCGQLFALHSRMDGAGSSESYHAKVVIQQWKALEP